jgi:hypothetical protein
MNAIKKAVQDILIFFRRHWPHFVIAAPMAIVITVIHEFAHCVGVWIQGGKVTKFVWLPSLTEWGHMEYMFPDGTKYNAVSISLFPYIFWVILCLTAGALSYRRRQWPFWAASTIFLWMFIAPLADIANAIIPYLLWNSYNDFYQAFGQADISYCIAALLSGGVFAVYGYLINQRLYCERAIGLPAYCLLAAAAAAAITVLNSI